MTTSCCDSLKRRMTSCSCSPLLALNELQKRTSTAEPVWRIKAGASMALLRLETPNAAAPAAAPAAPLSSVRRLVVGVVLLVVSLMICDPPRSLAVPDASMASPKNAQCCSAAAPGRQHAPPTVAVGCITINSPPVACHFEPRREISCSLAPLTLICLQ